MLLAFALIGAALLCALFSAFRAYLRAQSRNERSLLVRISLFSGLAILFAIALLARAPVRYVILTAVPLFFITAVTAKIFESARRRSQKPDCIDVEVEVEQIRRSP